MKGFLNLLNFVIRLDGIYIASFIYFASNSVLEVMIISIAAIHYVRSDSQVSTSFHSCSACLSIVLKIRL